MFPFHTPLKHQKIDDFVVFSGGIKMKTFARNGLKKLFATEMW